MKTTLRKSNMPYGMKHRRRIELEDKAKVVQSVLGDRILAALAVLPR